MTADPEGGFAPPPFKPDAALLQLKRSLRDLKLAERGNGFELRGKRVAELSVDTAAINAHLARTLALTPQWDAMVIRSATDQRKFVDEIKKRLARWTQDE
jgi:hypothetical protein